METILKSIVVNICVLPLLFRIDTACWMVITFQLHLEVTLEQLKELEELKLDSGIFSIVF
jgi:hypothetical protein